MALWTFVVFCFLYLKVSLTLISLPTVWKECFFHMIFRCCVNCEPFKISESSYVFQLSYKYFFLPFCEHLISQLRLHSYSCLQGLLSVSALMWRVSVHELFHSAPSLEQLIHFIQQVCYCSFKPLTHLPGLFSSFVCLDYISNLYSILSNSVFSECISCPLSYSFS